MSTKPCTPQGISALLRRAGFRRSVITNPQSRGWGREYSQRSDGFQVKGITSAPGMPWQSVAVRHMTGRMASDTAVVARKKDMLAQYAEVIRAAGWAVTGPAKEGWQELTVTAAERAATS